MGTACSSSDDNTLEVAPNTRHILPMTAPPPFAGNFSPRTRRTGANAAESERGHELGSAMDVDALPSAAPIVCVGRQPSTTDEKEGERCYTKDEGAAPNPLASPHRLKALRGGDSQRSVARRQASDTSSANSNVSQEKPDHLPLISLCDSVLCVSSETPRPTSPRSGSMAASFAGGDASSRSLRVSFRNVALLLGHDTITSSPEDDDVLYFRGTTCLGSPESGKNSFLQLAVQTSATTIVPDVRCGVAVTQSNSMPSGVELLCEDVGIAPTAAAAVVPLVVMQSTQRSQIALRRQPPAPLPSATAQCDSHSELLQRRSRSQEALPSAANCGIVLSDGRLPLTGSPPTRGRDDRNAADRPVAEPQPSSPTQRRARPPAVVRARCRSASEFYSMMRQHEDVY